jgi:mannose-6-phosphate isomerase
LYPLTFQPRLKPRPWGGQALAELYQKPVPAGERVGESWEITDRPGDAGVIANGPLAGRDLRWLMEQHGPAVLGAARPVDDRFPLLVKILDAREVLSVQVHPPPRVAARRGGEPKTELWYVTRAGPGARLWVGLKAGTTRAEFEQRIRDGTVAELLHQVPVRAGDAMFLPSGRVHALGADLVIFEIQQNSDTTYRVFDWNRRGPDGRPRQLHLEAALESIDFADFEPALLAAPWQSQGPWRRRCLSQQELFRVEELQLSETAHRLWTGDRAEIFGVVEGELRLEPTAPGPDLDLKPGQFALVPAAALPVRITARAGTTFLAASPG